MGIEEGPACPLPIAQREHIVLGHGSGGKLSHDLITRTFLPALAGPALSAGDDAGRLELPDGTPPGDQHRFARGLAAVLPRRRYRQAGGVRHGQRRGHAGRHARCT